VERYVKGVQSTGTISTLKHFAANNTDYFRRKSNSIVDERTLHEIYLPSFKAGIDAGAMAVMTAYNLLNGEWTGQCANTIKELLRNKLGFRWLVMSDWWSVFDGVKVVKSGQDLEMPACLATLDMLEKIRACEVAEADIDRMVKSILTTLKAMDLFAKTPQPKLLSQYPIHEQIAQQTAREGTVLLRNQGNILPLKNNGDDILLLGTYIHKKAVGGGSSEVKGYNQITLFQALKHEFGEAAHYEASPTDDMIRSAKRIILSVGTQDAESWDRPFVMDNSEELYIKRIVKLNANVVVLVNTGSGVRMTDWYQQAAAIVYCFYNGQNGNTALAEIITGKINPSGKLPFTIEREFTDGPGANYIPPGEALYYGENNAWEAARAVYDVPYQEGVLVGYRWYDTKQIEPLYPFGFGLSYTEFHFQNLTLHSGTDAHGVFVDVTCEIQNIGKMSGQEVVQIYVSDIESSEIRPAKELKGFRKITLNSGETKKFTLRLTQAAFSFWSSTIKNWLMEAGEFEISVGNSSRNILLRKSIYLT
jgi:beta-glucosidase